MPKSDIDKGKGKDKIISTSTSTSIPKTPETGGIHKRKTEDRTPPSDKKEVKKVRPVAFDDIDEEEMGDVCVSVDDGRSEETDKTVKTDTERKTVDSTSSMSREEILTKKLDGLVEAVQFLTTSMHEIKKTLEETRNGMKIMTILKELNCVKEQNLVLMDRIRRQEDYSRRDNIIVTGMKEEKDEDCRMVAAKLLKDGFDMDNVELVRAHRLRDGNKTNNTGDRKSRKLIIRFRYHSDKEQVMKNKWNLKDKMRGVYIDDDYCDETSRRRASLQPILKEVKKQDSRAHLRGDHIYSNGRLYTQRNLNDLPIDVHGTCTKSEGDATLFARTYSKLSNLYFQPFPLDGVEWHSVEHYVQYHKALVAGEVRTAREIRMTSDPLDAMAVGRRVRPGHNWNTKGLEVMRAAQVAKFSIPAMKVVLANTRPLIAQATRDKYSGIGLTLYDKDAMNTHKWDGQNMVGKTLMSVRDQICNK